MDTASRIFQTIDALKGADPNVFHSKMSTVDEPAPTCTGVAFAGGQPESDKTYTQIKWLFLQDFSKLRTLTWAKNFPSLEKLWIYGSDKISDLEGIQAAKYLGSVTVWPSFSGKITLKNLSPIGALDGLEELIWAGGTRDGSLEVLNSLQNLKKVFLSNSYSWQEISCVEAHHPEADFPWKAGIVHSENPGLLKCKKCGTAQSMLAGKGLRLASPTCDSAYIEKLLKRNPGSFALAMSASLAPNFAETTFVTFCENARRCLENDGCIVRNMSSSAAGRTPEDLFRLVLHTHSDPSATYGSLAFVGTSFLDGTPVIRSVFFVRSGDSVIALMEPRDSTGHSFEISGSLVHDVLIFEDLHWSPETGVVAQGLN